MTGDTPATSLRAWARGAYGLEAAVEILARAFDGRFAREGQPWIIRGHADGMSAVDIDQLAAAATEGPYSGGERRILAIVASLAGGRPVNLADAVTGIDRANAALVLAGIAHANGSHEHSAVHVDPDTGQPSFTRQPSLYPWPGHTTATAGTATTLEPLDREREAVREAQHGPAADDTARVAAAREDDIADAADEAEDGAAWT